MRIIDTNGWGKGTVKSTLEFRNWARKQDLDNGFIFLKETYNNITNTFDILFLSKYFEKEENIREYKITVSIPGPKIKVYKI